MYFDDVEAPAAAAVGDVAAAVAAEDGLGLLLVDSEELGLMPDLTVGDLLLLPLLAAPPPPPPLA